MIGGKVVSLWEKMGNMIKLEQSQIDALIEHHRKEIRDIEGKIRALELFKAGSVEVVEGVNVVLNGPVKEMFNPRRMCTEMLNREGRFLKTKEFMEEAIVNYGQKAGVGFGRQLSNVLAAMKVAGRVVNYEEKGRKEKYWGLPDWVDVKGKPLPKRMPR